MLGWGQLGTLTAVGAARSRDKRRTEPSMCSVHSGGKQGSPPGLVCAPDSAVLWDAEQHGELVEQ